MDKSLFEYDEPDMDVKERVFIKSNKLVPKRSEQEDVEVSFKKLKTNNTCKELEEIDKRKEAATELEETYARVWFHDRELCGYPVFTDTDQGHMVHIGFNQTSIPAHVFYSMNWCYYVKAIKNLLLCSFSGDVLATHNLKEWQNTSRLSVKESIKELDPCKVADIIHIVTLKSRIPASLVRSTIVTTCLSQMHKKLKMYSNHQI